MLFAIRRVATTRHRCRAVTPDYAVQLVTQGRLLSDVYLAAKACRAARQGQAFIARYHPSALPHPDSRVQEFLHEKNYALTDLVRSQLDGRVRVEMAPDQVAPLLGNRDSMMSLVDHAERDAQSAVSCACHSLSLGRILLLACSPCPALPRTAPTPTAPLLALTRFAYHLMVRLEVLPLTRQLTMIAGNLWSAPHHGYSCCRRLSARPMTLRRRPNHA